MMAPTAGEDKLASSGAEPSMEGDLPESDSFLDSPISSQHDSDEDFSVIGVLAEAFDGNERLYLIQWAGYGEEDWSWEPEENLSAECLKEWAQTNAKQRRGEAKPFDVEQWERNCQAIRKRRLEQHKRRNWARKRRGMELNLYPGETLADYDDSGEAAADDDFNDLLPPPRPIGQASEPGKATAPSPAPTSTSIGNLDESRTHFLSREGPPSNLRRRPVVDQTRNLENQPTGSSRERSGQRPQLSITTSSHRGAAKTSTSVAAARQAGESAPSLDRPKPSSMVNALLTAKKSSNADKKQPARSSTGNVFVSGKPNPTRQRLENTADSAKAPRMYPSRSIIRRAELRSRDLADRAPATPVGLGLFPISTSTGPMPRPFTTATDTISPSQAVPETSPITPLNEPVKSALRRPRDSSPTGSDVQEITSRKKPRVRFTEEVIDVSESPRASPVGCAPPGVDQGLGPGQEMERENGITKPATAQTPHHLSFRDDRPRRETRSLNKKVSLGPVGSQGIDVAFDGIPLPSKPWVPSFANAALVFSFACTAKDFIFQCGAVPHLRARTLAWGSVISQAQAGALDIAADQLRLGSFGLVSFHADFYVIVYPARCEDWKHGVPEAEPVSPAGVALKYLVLQSSSPEAARGLAIPPAISHNSAMPTGNTSRVKAMSLFFGLSYDQLLPTELRSRHRTHNFFLTFPPSKRLTYNFLCAWLRDANPACRIFSSLDPGDWRAFIDISAEEGGCIIIHETATSTVRLFPNVAELLFDKDNSSFSFWSFEEGLQKFPYGLSLSAHAVYPGQFRFSRLFPHGSAILFTPSFLIAQPCRARQLLSRYYARLDEAKFYVKLAVSANICSFLEELALEKLEEHRALVKRHTQMDTSKAEAKERLLGLTKEDCTARFELLAVTRRLMDIQNNKAGREPFILVDKSIDANDEQSIVNWFGWWSQTHLDLFRMFYVLGSHDEDNGRAVHRVPIPRYVPGTTDDPDVAFHGATQTVDSSSSPAVVGFLSTIVRNGDADSFHCFLRELSNAPPYFMRLYAYAVSYFQNPVEMADHFGDLKMEFESYRSWFNYAWSFGRGFNTYIGLFYTIETAWDPKRFKKNELPMRHPWIAVYRVQNPHFAKRRATELIIWDTDAPRRFPGSSTPHRSKLIPAQQALIEFLENKGSEKNPELPLERVWLGGYQSPSVGNPSAIDETLEMLQALVGDVRRWLPAPEIHMHERGYKMVELTGHDTTTGSDRMNLDSPAPNDPAHPDPDAGKDAKIVFHPPRSNGTTGAKRTECRNALFLEATELRSREKTAKRMSFKFPTTLKWYMLQKAEGRHFEHIRFETWEGIFNALAMNGGRTGSGPAGVAASATSSVASSGTSR
ncbi:hypothetical protein SODALDRAFT_329923 [Sodiomyces alkalinus F11]|uniref:Chromo domain-containing protein n=1 Tax=Sodiomyces alkalinus (strain CBS 110278 / VKM F-3762 / F11) TaxID=1314773 RepID=A0A3N2Q0M1_SODAK|nr:hypothetical protein SODALDRAFT_329923 [Sodiomyces alkalinus F11]ROT40238.1 hypothetical protein SODALDRAFT_329923 [Sodiomyces alkalinus F11]